MGGRQRSVARYVLHRDGSFSAGSIHHSLAGKIPAGRVSNEIVHIVDMYPTLARVAGAKVPTDRAIDGIDQLDFFLGKQENSNREGFPAYVADRLQAVKWHNW